MTTTDTPTQHTVRFSASITVDYTVDVRHFYETLSAPRRADYQILLTHRHDNDADDCDDLEYYLDTDHVYVLAWQAPMAFLDQVLSDHLDVSDTGVPHVVTDSDLHDWESSVRRRPFTPTGNPVRDWTEEDYNHLISQVPWLAGLDRQLADLRAHPANYPSPPDRPLF